MEKIKKKVYICHPFTGGTESFYWNVAQNQARIRWLIGKLAAQYPDYYFSAPYATSEQYKSIPDHDAISLLKDEIKTCDEVWLYYYNLQGLGILTQGQLQEVEFAIEHGIPVIMRGRVLV